MVKVGKQVKVYFSYNQDLVDIMRKNEGWWWHKEKCWSFPVGQTSELYDQLKKEGYNVQITKGTEQPKKKEPTKRKPVPITKLFENPNVVSVYDTCSKCKQKKYVGRDGICTECHYTKK